jgi:hypothetical protein
MKLLDETKKYVDSLFEPKHIPHFKRTLYWLKKLKPDADEALQIAAYAHDIGRYKNISPEEFKKLGWKKFTELHQIEGENMINEFLSKHTEDKELIQTVGFLIRHHEEGGTPDADLIKDVDSLSFFDTNVSWFIDKDKIRNVESSKEKLNWMFNRITSEKAKKIARPMYEDAMRKLENL